MAWLDPEWHERDRRHRERIQHEGPPRPPESRSNRAAARITAVLGTVLIAAVVVAGIIVLLAR